MAEMPVTPPETDRTSTGLDPNTAALLCYLLTWVTGLIFYLIEKDNRYVRFHAMQAILFGVTAIIGGVVLTIIGRILDIIPFIGPLTGLLLTFIFWVGYIIVYIYLMVQAYQGVMYKLPVLGDIAERNI